MKKQSANPTPKSIPLGISISSLAILLLGGGVLIWFYQEQRRIEAPFDNQKVSLDHRFENLPERPMLTVETANIAMPNMNPSVPLPLTAIHSFRYSEENGVKVVRIRVTPGGDEIVVDAVTGRLIESQMPTRPVVKEPARLHPLAPMANVQMIQSPVIN